MPAFDIYSWSALPFIAPVVSFLRFIVMDRIRKDTTDYSAVTVTESFNGVGVCDIAITLKVDINTVIRTLKNAHHDE